MKRNQNRAEFSPRSLAGPLAEPGREVLTSVDVGWKSLLLQVLRSPGRMDSFETRASPDQLMVFVLDGVYEIESISPSTSGKAHYVPGRGGLTSAMTTSRLRWSSATHTILKTLHLYLPQAYIQEAAEEYRHIGQPTDAFLPNLLSFDDPVLFSVAKSLADAASRGVPDLYAEAAASFLATHLLQQTRYAKTGIYQHKADHELTDRRLIRVLDFMRDRFAEQLTIPQLAREAAISPFHFARLFKAKLGVSPGQYLVELRLEHARTLLEQSDLTVSEIAFACGYVHSGHFSAAFRGRFSQTPSIYRASKRR